MALDRQVTRSLKRHHISLWFKQWQQQDPRPPLKQFLRDKLSNHGLKTDDGINIAGLTVDVVEQIEDDLSTYA